MTFAEIGEVLELPRRASSHSVSIHEEMKRNKWRIILRRRDPRWEVRFYRFSVKAKNRPFSVFAVFAIPWRCCSPPSPVWAMKVVFPGAGSQDTLPVEVGTHRAIPIPGPLVQCEALMLVGECDYSDENSNIKKTRFVVDEAVVAYLSMQYIEVILHHEEYPMVRKCDGRLLNSGFRIFRPRTPFPHASQRQLPRILAKG